MENPIVPNTVLLVAKNINRIRECKGKNLVVLIGREQVGKSTTINSLLGTKFIPDSKNKRVLVPAPGESYQAPMGCDEKSGLISSVFPAVYKDPKNDFFYLDAQGFFGTDENHDEVVAASILLDAAIKSAATVKIVYLVNFQDFSKGFTRIQYATELLNRVVLTNDVPVFCLFNRYTPPPGPDAEDFYIAQEPERNEMVRKELLEISEKLVKAAKENSEKLIKRTISNDQSSTQSTNNNENDSLTDSIANEAQETLNDVKSAQEAYKIERCAQLIDFNFKAGRYGYIDVSSEWSIENLRQCILQLPTINKASLSFNCCDQNRIRFSRDFEETLRKFADAINNVFFSLKFPPDTIELLIQKNKEERNKNQKLLEDLQKGVEVDLKDLLADLTEQKDETRKALRKLESDMMKLQNQKKRILTAPPIKYYDDPFDEPVSFFKQWRDHVVKYNLPIPFVAVEEHLDEGTLRDKIINFDIDKFTEYWDEDNHRTLLKIKEKEEPVEDFEVAYTSATKGKKAQKVLAVIAAGAAGAALSFFGLTALALPVGAAAGLAMGKSYNCTGVISFYVRYQDKESAVVKDLENSISHLQKLISEKQAEFEKIDSNLTESGKNALSSSISNYDDNIGKLEEINNFVKRVTEIWDSQNEQSETFKSMREELEAYNDISKMLYSPPIQNESVNNYLTYYNRLINASKDEEDVTSIKVINEYQVRNISNS